MKTGMHITPEMMSAMYDFILTTPPFRAWHKRGSLPPSDEVEFHVFSNNSHSADHIIFPSGKHRIRINARWCGTATKLYLNMVHEMIHVHIRQSCPTDMAEHGTRFKKCRDLVCRYAILDTNGF